MLTGASRAECDRVTAGPQGQLHGNTDDDVSAAGVGLVNNDARSAVHTNRNVRLIAQVPRVTAQTHLTVVFLQEESPLA